MSLQEQLRGTVQKLRRTPMPIADVVPMLTKSADKIDELEERVQYLEDSLVAICTGELPEKYTFNQFLLAQRARGYLAWLESTKGKNDSVLATPETIQ